MVNRTTLNYIPNWLFRKQSHFRCVLSKRRGILQKPRRQFLAIMRFAREFSEFSVPRLAIGTGNFLLAFHYNHALVYCTLDLSIMKGKSWPAICIKNPKKKLKWRPGLDPYSGFNPGKRIWTLYDTLSDEHKHEYTSKVAARHYTKSLNV